MNEHQIKKLLHYRQRIVNTVSHEYTLLEDEEQEWESQSKESPFDREGGDGIGAIVHPNYIERKEALGRIRELGLTFAEKVRNFTDDDQIQFEEARTEISADGSIIENQIGVYRKELKTKLVVPGTVVDQLFLEVKLILNAMIVSTKSVIIQAIQKKDFNALVNAMPEDVKVNIRSLSDFDRNDLFEKIHQL